MRNIQSGVEWLWYAYTPPTKEVLFSSNRWEIVHDSANGEIIITCEYPFTYRSATMWIDIRRKIVIADKNLWATDACSDGILTENNVGNFYQWGNNYWFPFTWAVNTSSTQVASGVGPYSSDVFIIWNDNWDSTNNPTLWWDTQDEEHRQWPCPNWWHTEHTLAPTMSQHWERAAFSSWWA